MKNLKLRTAILVLFICHMTLSCVTLQQPLPGSLWGEWAFVKTGVLTINGNNRLDNYRNVCYREGDRLHFSSDNKMSLRWYDESCVPFHYSIGRYHVDYTILNVDLATNSPYRDSSFPPITKYRIMQINATTLKLEEIPDGDRLHRDRAKSGLEPLVFVFMKLD